MKAIVRNWKALLAIVLVLAAAAVYGIIIFNRKRDAKAKLAAAGEAAIAADIAADDGETSDTDSASDEDQGKDE